MNKIANLPWAIDRFGNACDCNGIPVCWGGTPEENAAIIRAVNNYDALVEVLFKLLSWHGHKPATPDGKAEHEKVFEAACALMSKIGGKW